MDYPTAIAEYLTLYRKALSKLEGFWDPFPHIWNYCNFMIKNFDILRPYLEHKMTYKHDLATIFNLASNYSSNAFFKNYYKEMRHFKNYIKAIDEYRCTRRVQIPVMI